MRFATFLSVGIALACSVPASAQTAKQTDLLGVWYGSTDSEPTSPYIAPGKTKQENSLLVLWSDGLCYWEGGFTHGGGRWRLVGDSLWITHDWRYTYGGVFYRNVSARKENFEQKTNIDTSNMFTPVDTLGMPLFMKYLSNDPYYWLVDPTQRDSLYRAYYEKKFSPEDRNDLVGKHLIQGWLHSIYKVSLKDRQLTLVRMDSLKETSIPAQKWDLVRQGQPGFIQRLRSNGVWSGGIVLSLSGYEHGQSLVCPRDWWRTDRCVEYVPSE